MCIGVPMRVIECQPGQAVCEQADEWRVIDMRLVGDQPPGSWVLVFLDAAREVVTAEDAALVTQALEALNIAAAGHADGSDIDRLFPDLAGREPELPAHLRKQPA